MIYVTAPPPPLSPVQYFWSWLTPHQLLFVFCTNQPRHLLPCNLYFFASVTDPSPYTLSRWRKYHENIRRTYRYQCLTSSREFEVCLNKAVDNTWRKRSQNENRKPAPGNGIRLLLFDKCKFTKPLKWKKS